MHANEVNAMAVVRIAVLAIAIAHPLREPAGNSTVLVHSGVSFLHSPGHNGGGISGRNGGGGAAAHHDSKQRKPMPSLPPQPRPSVAVAVAVLEADVLDNTDEMTYETDGQDELEDVVFDGHLNEGALYDELNVDENRREPILKTVVILIALIMLYMGWRTHCRSSSGGSVSITDVSSSSGWHAPVPLDSADDGFGDDAFGRSSPPQHRAARSFDGVAARPQETAGGWTFDIFSLAASRLAL